MAALLVRFTRLSNERHSFEYRRPDGTGEAIELETRSMLFHDLLHFAVESEAGLRGSFYGVLAKVGGYAELAVNGGVALGGEAAITERVVGPLTSVIKGETEPAAFVERLQDHFRDLGEPFPRWLTPAFVLAVKERMRRLDGQWRATAFGEAMELSFPLPD